MSRNGGVPGSFEDEETEEGMKISLEAIEVVEITMLPNRTSIGGDFAWC
jgi:hypothetical protein